MSPFFTSDKTWPGPDVSISIDPAELKDLIRGSRAIQQASGGEKNILTEEKPTIDFAYACVVSIRDIQQGEILSRENIWVKRPGTCEIFADRFEDLLGKKINKPMKISTQLKWSDFE